MSVVGLKKLLHEGYVDEIRDRLQAVCDKQQPKGEQAKESFRKAMGYLTRQECYLRYDEYREARLPVGSGPAEATCKMFQARNSCGDWKRPQRANAADRGRPTTLV